LADSKESPKFITDNNVGKLGRWLRMMGYDTIMFNQPDDWDMVRIALEEERILITRDTQVVKRRVITSGKVRALLITDDDPEKQIHQMMDLLGLDCNFKPLSLCLECNEPLVSRRRDEVENCVPPYVFQTQLQFVECPLCHRIYWQGTHWQAMHNQLDRFCNVRRKAK
jgi:uncharacterized protein with PIN domain